MQNLFKKVKKAYEDYNGAKFSDSEVWADCNEYFGGDLAAMLADLNEGPGVSYYDDSWGDYEQGAFC